jgi:hypothetical protein
MVMSGSEYEAHLKTNHRGDMPTGGELIANYVNSKKVAFKSAIDDIVDAGQDTNNANCGWVKGQKGLGKDMEHLKEKIRGDGKFMWLNAKGRGNDTDKAAMVMDVDVDLVNDIATKRFQIEYRRFQKQEGRNEFYKYVPLDLQRRLPGIIRWAQTFENSNFGIFSYGDGEELFSQMKLQRYFKEEIVHGMGIHGRHLQSGNPSHRMLSVGMPWIGGVSGSIVDFFLMARALGYSGKDLSRLVLLEIGALVAGGQHSLSELVFGAMECQLAGGGQFTWGSLTGFTQLVKEMNVPEPEWLEVLKRNGGNLWALYLDALSEFVRKAGPSGFNDIDYVDGVKSVDKTSAPMAKCMKNPYVPAGGNFKRSVFEAGGAKSAWNAWSLSGLTSNETMTPEEFSFNLQHWLTSSANVIMCEDTFQELAENGRIEYRRLHQYAKGPYNGPPKPSIQRFLEFRTDDIEWAMERRNIGGRHRNPTNTQRGFAAAFLAMQQEEIRSLYACMSRSGKEEIRYNDFEALFNLVWQAPLRRRL